MDRANLERTLLRLLRKKDLRGALRTATGAGLLRFWGISLGAGKAPEDARALRTLQLIFEKTPSLLREAPADYIEQARIVAGLYYLLGEQRTKTVRIKDVIAPGTHILASWMPNVWLSYVSHLSTIEEYSRLSQPPLLKIYSCNDDMVCPHCAGMRHRVFSLEEIPEMPFAKCTSAYGCRCYTQPYVLRHF